MENADRNWRTNCFFKAVLWKAEREQLFLKKGTNFCILYRPYSAAFSIFPLFNIPCNL